jgi:hypothetical protein
LFAKENLESTSWQTSDTTDMFNSRFMKRLAVYHTTLSTANNTKHINKIGTNELVKFYLTRLVTTMPNTNSLYTRIRDELFSVQSHIDQNSPVHTSITLLTQHLQSLEALELQNTNIRPQNELRRPRTLTLPRPKHRNNAFRSTQTINHANTFIMVDIVANPTTSSITVATFLPYYLAITDVASRFFVPFGLKDKTADSVFQALQEWPHHLSQTPSSTFTC